MTQISKLLAALVFAIACATAHAAVNADGCDPAIQARLDSSRESIKQAQRDFITATFKTPPISAAGLSCLSEIIGQVQLSFTFPFLANFTVGGAASRIAQTLAQRVLQQVEAKVCSKVEQAYNKVLQPIYDIQNKLLSHQLPAGLGPLGGYYQPFTIEVQRKGYMVRKDEPPESAWDIAIRKLGF